MAIRSWGFVASRALGLAACQADVNSSRPVTATQSASAPRTVPAGFECPPSGTVVQFGANRRRYTGSDPADPLVCNFTATNAGRETSGQMLANLVFLPTQDDAVIRAGLAQLWPLTPGKRVSYTHNARNNDGSNFQLRQDLRVVGTRRMSIAGAERDVIVIENDRQNPNWTGYFVTWTFYYDPESRSMLGGDINVVRGSDRSTNWRASGVTLPL